MKRVLLALAFSLLLTPLRAADEAGFKPLFNGKDLTGWEGRPNHWSVEDGAITGKTTQENPAKGNNFLIWRPGGKNGTVSDFELRFSYKIVPNNDVTFANSGVQYRSKDFSDFVVGGYQGDFEAGKTYSGILYEEKTTGTILAQRGQKTTITLGDNGKPKVGVTGKLGDSNEIQSHIKDRDWNDYVIIAKGNHLQHFINGIQTIDVTDDRADAVKEGILALQLHAGQPMTVQFKNIRIKELSAKKSAKADLDLLQGSWVLAEMVANGEAMSAAECSRVNLKVDGDKYFVQGAPDGDGSGSFKLDESKSPRAMDVNSDGADVPAIYEISENTFRACYALNGASRPSTFASTSNSDHVLAVYKRKQ